MEFEGLFAHIEQNLYDVLEPGSEDIMDACKSIMTDFKNNEVSTDKMVAELHAVLNGACSAIVESLRDMGYNIEGRDHQAGRARSFQYLNSTISVFPLLSRYDLGAFFGCKLPTLIDLSTGCDPTFYEAVFEDTTGLELLRLPTSFGRVPSRFLAGSTIQHIHAPAVAMVGAYAFYNCRHLKSVEFSAINGADDYSFSNCEQLSVHETFFTVITFIGHRAFAGSGICQVDLMCPHFIGDYAFSSMARLESITAAVTAVPPSFASDCKNLKSVIIPFAKIINTGAFACNPMLTDLTMPNSVILYSRAFYETGLTSINLANAEFEGSSHFECCYRLRRIIFNSLMVKIPDRFCFGCSQLESLVTTVGGQPRNRVIHSNGKLGSLIPRSKSKRHAQNRVIHSKGELGSLIASKPKSIRYDFVDDFDNIIEATPFDCVLAPKLLTIGQSAFEWCEKLKEVNLWNTHKIKTKAFKNTGIENVVTRSRLDSGSFSSCKNLEAVNLPSQTKIPSRAFHNCSNLAWLQMTATDIGPYAFSGCKKLSINFASNAPCFIGPYAFEHCILDTVVLGDGSRIASYAFHKTGCASEHGKVCIGPGSRVVQRAFQESCIKRLSIGADVSVAAYGFQKCSSLHTVLSDTNLFSQGVFSNCSNLKSFIVTRPFQLKTKRLYSWRHCAEPTHEIFPRTYPRCSLISPSCILSCWSLGTSRHDREKFRLFYFCLARSTKTGLCPLPMELNLELVFSYFIRWRA